jgi:hypothetical protein
MTDQDTPTSGELSAAISTAVVLDIRKRNHSHQHAQLRSCVC